MARFWWVNHKQTVRQEIAGQYLWSPKVERGGARSQFYENMRLASPGDLVLSYADGFIRFIGRVTEYAFTAPKPEEFGLTGAYWSQEGWLLPVYWAALAEPIRPRDIIADLGPHLPTRYSPISSETGKGHQKVYLAEIGREAFDVITANAAFDHVSLLNGGNNSLTYYVVTELLDDAVERAVEADLALEDTVRRSVVLARRGQGRFRLNVEALEPACRVTGVTDPSLLIASHIKPWRLCSNANERLDGMNGLMLTPDVDLLFDRGFISFEDDGGVRVSSRVKVDDLGRLGLNHIAWNSTGFAEASAIWNAVEFRPKQREYLGFHRSEVFLP